MESLTLQDAKAIAEAASKKAEELKQSLSISIVDAAGRLLLSYRGDGTGFLTTDTSRAKAVAAAAFKADTRTLTEYAQSNPQFWNALPAFLSEEVLPTTGAVPIMVDGRLLGAIGCGGGTPEEDHFCAEAGAAVLQSSCR